MNRKPLEGIDSLLFALGASLGYFLAVQNYSWWVITLVIIVSGMIVGRFVEFLRVKNNMN